MVIFWVEVCATQYEWIHCFKRRKKRVENPGYRVSNYTVGHKKFPHLFFEWLCETLADFNHFFGVQHREKDLTQMAVALLTST